MIWNYLKPGRQTLIKQIQIVNYSLQNNNASKVYKPISVEQKWYKLWQEKLNEFNNQEDRQLFSMLFPPPNVTGNLHLGHALTTTIQDVLVRWKIMNKFKVVWVPGYDHAGIATQVVVEKKIWNEKKLTRHDLGKDEFIKEVFKWKDLKREVIKKQLVQMNALVDWNYEYFTMDNTIKNSVNEAFIELHKKNLIYRAFRPINWCCSLKSAISDAEVDNIALTKRTYLDMPGYEKPVEFGMIHSYDYPILDSDLSITVSTTRPETIFGDTAIAVNPNDIKYKHIHGKKCINPLNNETLEIILDEYVDSNFGTGAVKITPGHDYNDYETGVRHKLQTKTIFNEIGNLINVPEEFNNMPRFLARHKVINKLKAMNLWRSSSSHQMILPVCSRTGDAIEPIVKEQWFANSSKIFKICDEAVKSKELQIIPKMRTNLWNHYVKSYTTKDWCISRQLWWGQQIPAFKCSVNDQTKWIPAKSEKDARLEAFKHFEKLNKGSLKSEEISIQQDTDVFDTWFTSTLLPLAIFGWPFKANSDNTIYPTNILETGYDIMFFWAFRMVGICHALSGQLPFNQLLFHGLIRDGEGRKMSKSIGNVIDPNDLVNGTSLKELKSRIMASNLSDKEKKFSVKNQDKIYPKGIEAVGSDAMRLALLVQDFKSEGINLDMNHFTDAKRYCNKIWNAINYYQIFHSDKITNFRLMSIEEIITNNNLRSLDTWILMKLNETVIEVNKNFKNEFDLHQNIKVLRVFYYSNFFDFYLESTKPLLKNENFELIELVWNVLRTCNHYAMIMYHPFMPSITEELWQNNKGFEITDKKFTSILDFEYPKESIFEKLKDLDLERINTVINITKSIINNINSFKSISSVTTSKPKSNLEHTPQSSVELSIRCTDQNLKNELINYTEEIIHLTKIEKIRFLEALDKFEAKNSLFCEISDECEISLKFKEPIESEQVIDKFKKDLMKYEKKLNTIKELMLKTKYEQYSAELKAKTQQEMEDQQKNIKLINKQLSIFEQNKKYQ